MVKDIKAVETVQRRFTKRLPGFCSLSYAERLKCLNLPIVLVWNYSALTQT